VRFTVPGVPVAKAAPTHVPTARGFRKKKDEKTDRFENRVALAARQAGVPYIESGPVCLHVWAYFPSRNPPLKRGRRAKEWHTVRPDRTNILKAVEDGLNGVAFKDDGQVVAGAAYKLRCAQGDAEGPRTEIEVSVVYETILF